MVHPAHPAAADLLGPPPTSPEGLRTALEGVAVRLAHSLGLQACLVFLAEPGEPVLVLAAGVGVEAVLSWERGEAGGASPLGGTAWVPIEADGRRLGGLLLAWPTEQPDPRGSALAGDVARGLSSWLPDPLPPALPPPRAAPPEGPQGHASLDGLQAAAQALGGSLERGEVLQAVPRLAAAAVLARGAVLRLSPEKGTLTVVAAVAGVGTADAAQAPLRVGAGISGTVAREGVALLIPQAAEASGSASVGSCLCLPLTRGGRCIGTLTLFDKVRGDGGAPDQFSAEDLRLLRVLLIQGALVIQSATVLAESMEKAARLEALSRLTQQLTATLDSGPIVTAILDGIGSLSVGTAVRLWLRDPKSETLALAGARGFRDPAGGAIHRLEPGEGLAGLVAKSGRPEVIRDLLGDPGFFNRAWAESEGLASFLGLPLLIGGNLVGVLCIFTRSPRTFPREEIAFLEAFAARAATALGHARRFAEVQRLAGDSLRRYREIALLLEIGTAMQQNLQLDRLLHAILTAVTFGGGLGFNRACLLLVNDRGDALEGRMGVGPADAAEAGRIWQALSAPGTTLLGLLADGEGFRALERSPFMALARSLRVPLKPGGGVLAEAVLTRRTIAVGDAARDQRVEPAYEGRLGAPAFAVAPLLATDRAVGALVVDNKFSGAPIEARDLDFLELVAAQAGLAVERALLVERLEVVSREVQQTHHALVRQERLAVVGEMAADMVHKIRNPLTAIGGFARILERRLEPDHPEREAVEVIAREAARMERIAREALDLARGVTPSPAAVEAAEILEDCLLLFSDALERHRVDEPHDTVGPIQARLFPDALERHLVAVVREFAMEPVRAWADPAQLKQVVLNLLSNALEAMPHGGTLTLRTSGERGWASFTVADTGPGIPPTIRESIFDPFFTTKPGGTGLGLTLAYRLVEANGGRLELESHAGQGSAFRVWLPAARAAKGGVE